MHHGYRYLWAESITSRVRIISSDFRGGLPEGERPLCYHLQPGFSKYSSPVSIADLHSHSQSSDGLLSAGEVVRRAVANSVEMLALTDHDTMEGLPAARSIAEQERIRFVDGVEVSAEWGDMQVHIVGLAVDPSAVDLNAGLASIRSGRIMRAKRMSSELEKINIPGCFDGAMRYATNPSLIGRSHFARYLVEAAICKDVRSVFDSYMVPGKPGYVMHDWATMADAVNWIVKAGGVAVMAHPGRYRLSGQELRQLLGEFKDHGGQAIEVVSGSHATDAIAKFSRLAQEYGFLASCGSDFHGPEESYADLGAIPALPDGLTPVWSAF